MPLSQSDYGRISANIQHGAPISPTDLNAMANRLLEGTPEVCGVLTDHQIRHRARKERPRGNNPMGHKRVIRQVG